MAYKIFIADDHYMIIEGIRSLLMNEENIEWMGHAMNGASCLASISEQQPDVLLLDINLPDISGIELCLELTKNYPDMNILGLSSYNQLSYIQKMMSNGASGYLLKNAEKDEILDAIETVMSGKKYFSKEAAAMIQENRNKKIPAVTRREKEVLQLIADGYTNHQIAEKLFISSATVDTHRTSLLSKFEVKNTANLIRIAIQFDII